MPGHSLGFLSDQSIGIIGCGHLGRALALQFLSRGLPVDRLKVSCGGGASSLDGIKRAGLICCQAKNEDICRDCSIIFISVRPQSLPDLKCLSFRKDALVVSCMAGVSLQAVKKHLGADGVRIMPSGPSTIQDMKGIVAIYPHNDIMARILKSLELNVFALPDEELMHIFTAGVCLPAVLLASESDDQGRREASRTLAEEYAEFPRIFAWAKQVLPKFEDDEEISDYIRMMATKGGITEAMIESLKSDSSLTFAIKKGIKRSREIASSFD
jgi:pyrroline-5-carboxylate reductase